MLPRDRASLLDILEQIRIIREHLDGVTREAFLVDLLRKDAVTLRVENIGEAAARLSEDFRAAHPEVPWRKIRELRNILVHIYEKVNYRRVWVTTQEELEPLRQAIKFLLAADTTNYDQEP